MTGRRIVSSTGSPPSHLSRFISTLQPSQHLKLSLCSSRPYRREGERKHKIGFRFQVGILDARPFSVLAAGRASTFMSSVHDARHGEYRTRTTKTKYLQQSISVFDWCFGNTANRQACAVLVRNRVALDSFSFRQRKLRAIPHFYYF